MSKLFLKQLSSLEKVFLDSKLDGAEFFYMTALKNEEFSYQIAFWAEERMTVRLKIKSDIDAQINMYVVENVPSELPAYTDAYDDNYITIKPGLFPDILSPVNDEDIVVSKTPHAIWISVKTHANTQAGHYKIEISFENDEKGICESKVFKLDILDAQLPPQKLMFTQWLHVDCIATHYNVDIFSEKHWELIRSFIKMAVEHGINMILTPIVTPPLDTEVGGERPTAQLVDIFKNGNVFSFNFEKLKRWVDMCKEEGVQYFEMAHLFTQWGAEFTPKIMVEEIGELKRLFGWDVKADSDEYKLFLSQFLPKLVEFLIAEGIAENTVFHISDEPHGEAHIKSYAKAKKMVYEYIKDFKIIDALSDYSFYESGLVTNPIPANNAIEPFLKNNVKDLWTYYCCVQNKEVSNRFMAMPAARNRILAYQLYKYNIVGFLHWGYNFYYSRFSKKILNPFHVTDAQSAFASGDAFSVYPGKNEPLASTRLKVFNDALQDLRALELLETLISKEEIIEMLEKDLDSPIDFKKYPKDSEYILNMRNRINNKIMLLIEKRK